MQTKTTQPAASFVFQASHLISSIMQLLATLVFGLSSANALLAIPKKYHSFKELETFLRKLEIRHPERSHLYTIGHSLEKRPLLVIAVAADNPHKHVPGRPEVKYVANIHGDEPIGRQLLLYLADYLLSAKDDPRVAALLNSTRIHLLPSMNPDAFEVAEEGVCDFSMGRFNRRNYDLNRNFPDRVRENYQPVQPETMAIIKWIKQIPFLLSGSFHGGALVANYPYDNSVSGKTEYARAPDDDVFQMLASTYASLHPYMRRNHRCEDQPTFPGGITNGAEWYPFRGGMQDYNYIFAGSMEITLEVSCCKFPPGSELPAFWNRNQDAMLGFLQQANRGVRGFILDEQGHGVSAVLTIDGRNVSFNSTKLGEFWRILLPGYYVLHIDISGHKPVSFGFTVIETEYTVCNVTLTLNTEEILVSKMECFTPSGKPMDGNRHVPKVVIVTKQEEEPSRSVEVSLGDSVAQGALDKSKHYSNDANGIQGTSSKVLDLLTAATVCLLAYCRHLVLE